MASTQPSTSNDNPLFRSPRYGVSIRYPSGWASHEGYAGSVVTFISSSPQDFPPPSLNLLVQDHSGIKDINLETFTKMSLDQLPKVMPNMSHLRVWDKTLANQPGKRATYQSEMGPSLIIKFFQAWTMKGKNAYVMTFTAAANEFDRYLPTIEQVVDTFAFLSKEERESEPVEHLFLAKYASLKFPFEIKYPTHWRKDDTAPGSAVVFDFRGDILYRSPDGTAPQPSASTVTPSEEPTPDYVYNLTVLVVPLPRRSTEWTVKDYTPLLLEQLPFTPTATPSVSYDAKLSGQDAGEVTFTAKHDNDILQLLLQFTVRDGHAYVLTCMHTVPDARPVAVFRRLLASFRFTPEGAHQRKTDQPTELLYTYENLRYGVACQYRPAFPLQVDAPGAIITFSLTKKTTYSIREALQEAAVQDANLTLTIVPIPAESGDDPLEQLSKELRALADEGTAVENAIAFGGQQGKELAYEKLLAGGPSLKFYHRFTHKSLLAYVMTVVAEKKHWTRAMGRARLVLDSFRFFPTAS